ncbi:unnamed protein product [Nezara viridula]|nr:unnamed protein product [Nezara viridula]
MDELISSIGRECAQIAIDMLSEDCNPIRRALSAMHQHYQRLQFNHLTFV